MTRQNIDLLNKVINTLMLIDTHGENSFAMVQCIQTLRSVAESETARWKTGQNAPVENKEE